MHGTERIRVEGWSVEDCYGVDSGEYAGPDGPECDFTRRGCLDCARPERLDLRIRQRIAARIRIAADKIARVIEPRLPDGIGSPYRSEGGLRMSDAL